MSTEKPKRRPRPAAHDQCIRSVQTGVQHQFVMPTSTERCVGFVDEAKGLHFANIQKRSRRDKIGIVNLGATTRLCPDDRWMLCIDLDCRMQA